MVRLSPKPQAAAFNAANKVMRPRVTGCSAATAQLAEFDLGRSGITMEQAANAGLFPVDDASSVNPDFAAAPGIIIPYFDQARRAVTYLRDGHVLPFCRVRYLPAPGFPLPRDRKYDQPCDSGTPPYFPLDFNWSAAEDGSLGWFVIVEGEKKAIALCRAGIPAVAVGGVFNFGENGVPLHSALAALAGKCPETFIVFDSDAATKPQVQTAEWRLAGQLALAGSLPHTVRLPARGHDKVGADDYIVSHGAGALRNLILSSPALGLSAQAANDDLTVSDLLDHDVAPVEELIPGWVERGIPNFIAGPGGVHKSRLALQWGLCINAGTAVWGIGAVLEGVKPPLATLLYCSAEDDANELARRVQAISAALGLKRPDRGQFIVCRGNDSALVVMNESGQADFRPFFHELLARLKAIAGHKVVVLDSAYDFVRFAGRAKIDEDSVNYFIKVVLQRLCDLGDCTLIIPWHPSQAGSERGNMDGWSVAWHNAPRARLALKAVRDVPDTYELSVTKRNHGPKGQPLRLRFHEGALLPVEALPEDGKSAALRGACIQAALTAAEKQSPFTKQRKVPGWALKEAEAATGQSVTNAQFHEELETAVREGALCYMPGTNKQVAGYYPPDKARAHALARRDVRQSEVHDD